MTNETWTPEPPAPTRLYRCSDYPRRVRAESPGAAAVIVARYLARKRFGRSVRLWSVESDGRVGASEWHYRSTVIGPQARCYGNTVLGTLRISVRTEA